MKPTTRLFQHACRLTLFVRKNCSLCTNAKDVLSNVWDKRPFEYSEIDVMTPEGKSWKAFYEFDTPVVHVSNSKAGEENPALIAEAKKLMHRFTAEQINGHMDAVETEQIK